MNIDSLTYSCTC